MQPLEGLRVVDFTRHMAGPYGTAMLSDYGADVVKVEGLPHGDPTRRMGKHFTDGESALFLMWNRGKRSLGLDLRSKAGLEVVDRLVARADVLVHNYRPGVADDIGIGYEHCSALNPRLIYCAVSAFGSEGPWARRPGTDPVIQAMSGVMSVTGEADRPPVLVGVPIADFTGSLLCVQGVLLALAARHRTGRGQLVEVSMLHGLIASLTTRLATHWATGQDPTRHGAAHSVVVPYQVFEAADGHVVAGVWDDSGWSRFCAALGRPDLLQRPEFATNVARVEHRETLIPILEEAFRSRTVAELDRDFEYGGALFGPVLTFSEVLEHPQTLAWPLVTTTGHARLGSTRQLGPSIRLSETPGSVRSGPPVLAEHSGDILSELGYKPEEIDDLERAGVILDART